MQFTSSVVQLVFAPHKEPRHDDRAEIRNEVFRPNQSALLRIQPTEAAHGYHYGVDLFGSGFNIISGPSGTTFCQNQHSRPLTDQ